MNPTSPDSTPCPPLENIDVVTSHALISEIPTSGKPVPTRSVGALRPSSQKNFHVHDSDHQLPDIRGMCRAPVNGNPLDASPEKLVPEVVERYINEIAEVTHPTISPSHSHHHTSASGARAWEQDAKGEEGN